MCHALPKFSRLTRNVTNSRTNGSVGGQVADRIAGRGYFTDFVDRITRDVCNMHGTGRAYTTLFNFIAAAV